MNQINKRDNNNIIKKKIDITQDKENPLMLSRRICTMLFALKDVHVL